MRIIIIRLPKIICWPGILHRNGKWPGARVAARQLPPTGNSGKLGQRQRPTTGLALVLAFLRDSAPHLIDADVVFVSVRRKLESMRKHEVLSIRGRLAWFLSPTSYRAISLFFSQPSTMPFYLLISGCFPKCPLKKKAPTRSGFTTTSQSSPSYPFSS